MMELMPSIQRKSPGEPILWQIGQLKVENDFLARKLGN
jgi:hypothetical protein